MEWSPPSEANSYSTGQGILCLSWNVTVNYCVHNNLSLDPMQSKPYYFKIHFNITLPFKPKFLFLSAFLTKILNHFSSPSHVLYAAPISSMILKYLAGSKRRITVTWTHKMYIKSGLMYFISGAVMTIPINFMYGSHRHGCCNRSQKAVSWYVFQITIQGTNKKLIQETTYARKFKQGRFLNLISAKYYLSEIPTLLPTTWYICNNKGKDVVVLS